MWTKKITKSGFLEMYNVCKIFIDFWIRVNPFFFFPLFSYVFVWTNTFFVSKERDRKKITWCVEGIKDKKFVVDRMEPKGSSVSVFIFEFTLLNLLSQPLLPIPLALSLLPSTLFLRNTSTGDDDTSFATSLTFLVYSSVYLL